MDRMLTKVLVERERLLARAERERADLAVACRGLSAPAAVVDRIIDAGRFLRAHPLATGGLAAGIVVLRTRSVLGLATRALGAWRLLRRLRTVAHLLGR
jgi:hypothetical protein